MLFCASGEAEKHPRGPEAIARLSSLLLHLSKWPHLFPRVVSVRVSALFLMENESPAKILTRFSTVFLHSLHFSSMRASISSQRRDGHYFLLLLFEYLFPSCHPCALVLLFLCFLCFTFRLFQASPGNLVSTYFIPAFSWFFWLYFFYCVSCFFPFIF